MNNQLTKANINLYSILRNMEDLVRLDPEMREMVKEADIKIQFNIKNGPKGNLQFDKGTCIFRRGEHMSDVKLYFKSPEHFNLMVDGKKNPIPTKGFTKLGFLKNDFMKLTERLTYYLKPTDELLKDESYLDMNTRFTAFTAFYALSEIANSDELGKINASRIPDGIIGINIEGDPLNFNIICEKGHLTTVKGMDENARAVMSFADISTANAVLNGTKDFYTCLATEKVVMRGFIPMLDNLNKLLAQIPGYVQ